MDPYLQSYLKKTNSYQILLKALNNEFVKGEFEGKQHLVQQKLLKLLEDHVYNCNKVITVNFRGLDDTNSFYTQQIQGMLRFHGGNVQVEGASVQTLDFIATENDGLIPQDDEDESDDSSEINI